MKMPRDFFPVCLQSSVYYAFPIKLTIITRVARLRASPKHGGIKRFIVILRIDPPRGRPFGGGGIHPKGKFRHTDHRKNPDSPIFMVSGSNSGCCSCILLPCFFYKNYFLLPNLSPKISVTRVTATGTVIQTRGDFAGVVGDTVPELRSGGTRLLSRA